MKKSLLERRKANPKGDWTISDVKTLCRRVGLDICPPSGGSHYTVQSAPRWYGNGACWTSDQARLYKELGRLRRSAQAGERTKAIEIQAAPSRREKALTDYPIVIVPLSEEDGGGYLGYAPDLKGCMSDGETPDTALANAMDAVREWLAACKAFGRPIPEPGSAARRARAERDRLVSLSKEVVEKVENVDQRLDLLSKEIEHLSELADHWQANERFESITGIRLNHRNKVRPRRRSSAKSPH